MNKRMPKWFKEWHSNEFWHLSERVRFNTKLLWILLACLIAAALIDRLMG